MQYTRQLFAMTWLYWESLGIWVKRNEHSTQNPLAIKHKWRKTISKKKTYFCFPPPHTHPPPTFSYPIPPSPSPIPIAHAPEPILSLSLTIESLSQLHVGLGDVAHTIVHQVQATLLRVVGVQRVQNCLHWPVHITFTQPSKANNNNNNNDDDNNNNDDDIVGWLLACLLNVPATG